MADRVAVRSACRRPPLALATAGAYLDLHPLIAATGRLLGLAVVTEQKRTLRTGLARAADQLISVFITARLHCSNCSPRGIRDRFGQYTDLSVYCWP